MHQIKQKRILSAMLSLLLLASAVSCSADEGQTKISDSTKADTAAIETEIATELVTETEIVTEAVTEGPSVTEDVHADEGIVNVKGCIEYLKSIGYDGVVSVETEGSKDFDEVVTLAAKSYEYLNKIIKG